MGEGMQFFYFLMLWLSATTIVGIILEVVHRRCRGALEEIEGRKRS